MRNSSSTANKHKRYKNFQKKGEFHIPSERAEPWAEISNGFRDMDNFIVNYSKDVSTADHSLKIWK